MPISIRASALAVSISLAAGPAGAADLPSIKLGGANKVPACATPGRLMEFAKSRNATLDRRFDSVATEYMRHGEELKIRWDYAFFQMLVETANLSFKRGNGSWGDVKPKQNNFAGLGATGGGEPGESFPDVSTGVKGHLQHVLLYAGEHVDQPVAERTRKVQEWGILKAMHKDPRRPVTFADLTKRWSPKDAGYARDIDSVASRFYQSFCDKPDARPEQVAEARRGHAKGKVQTLVAAEPTPTPALTSPQAAPAQAVASVPPAKSGADLAREARERAAAEGIATRSSLGATALAKAAAEATAAEPAGPAKPSQSYVILNAPKLDEPQADPVATVQTASAAAGSAKLGTQALTPSAPGKCRVWTASYGGQKAIIIRSQGEQLTNYTVLDVNEGAEKREADAYISAYAKGGQLIAEFATQDQALDKAFDLCPES